MKINNRLYNSLLLMGALLASLSFSTIDGTTPKVAAASSPVVHEILAIGQSNVVGKSYTYSATLDPCDPRILEYTTSGVLKKAVEPLVHPDPVQLGGPLLAAARKYLKSQPVAHWVNSPRRLQAQKH